MMNLEIPTKDPDYKCSSSEFVRQHEEYEDHKELSQYANPRNSEHDFKHNPNEYDKEKKLDELYEHKKELSDNMKEIQNSKHEMELSPNELLPEYKEKELGRNKKEKLNHESIFENNVAEFVSEDKKETTQNNEPENIDFSIVTKIPKDTRHFLWTINEFSRLPIFKELYSPGIYRLHSSWCRLKLVKNETGFCLYYVNSLKPVQKNHPETPFCNSYSSASNVLQSTHMTQNVTGIGNSFSFASTVSDAEGISHENVFSSTLEFDISATDYKQKKMANWSVTCSGSKDPICEVIGEYITNPQTDIPKGILILNCHLKITMAPVSEKTSFKRVTEKLVPHSWIKLSADLKYMYQTSLNADVTLTVGTDKILANKSILMARCPFFKKMFENETKENVQSVMEITDVPHASLKKLVEFLYTGKLEVNVENFGLQDLHDLYYAANKYEVMDLKSICAKLLLLRATVDNVILIFTWAHQCNDRELKLQLINFIRVNFDAIVDADSWATFVVDQTILASEIVKICFKELKKSGFFY
ncbi:unnamed protein product [Larinioides sclopetarius]|uniref:BTB domain-containing protein n=1 Tax=Larinioides sclopetarius TaxID=280406 RepID=A0AAV2BK79_9ARAC